MKVLSQFFAKLSPSRPTPIFKEGENPWDPPEEIKTVMKLLASPDGKEARLITGRVAAILDGHCRKMYLPNQGTVDLITNAETWRLAVELIELVEKIDVMVKPDQKLFGSGATVHYPKDGDYAVILPSDEIEVAK